MTNMNSLTNDHADALTHGVCLEDTVGGSCGDMWEGYMTTWAALNPADIAPVVTLLDSAEIARGSGAAVLPYECSLDVA